MCTEGRKKTLKSLLLTISLSTNVMSQETAYVGVDKETRHALPIPASPRMDLYTSNTIIFMVVVIIFFYNNLYTSFRVV